jgi:HAD superfamily hydrolase (TIGR01509 family)
MTNFRAALFDIDGTLVDSNEQHVISWALAFRNAGHSQEADAIRRQIGKGGDLLIPVFLPDASELRAHTISEQQGHIFADAYLANIRPFPDATEVIKYLHDSGLRVVLASSAKQTEIDHYVELLGINSWVAATASIDDVIVSKPEPDIFSVALEKISVGPEQAVVIGDTIYDVEGASKAGMVTVAVSSGPFSADELREAGAVRVFADVSELLAYLRVSSLDSLA